MANRRYFGVSNVQIHEILLGLWSILPLVFIFCSDHETVPTNCGNANSFESEGRVDDRVGGRGRPLWRHGGVSRAGSTRRIADECAGASGARGKARGACRDRGLLFTPRP